MSHFLAVSQSVTGSLVKKNVNIEPTRLTVMPGGRAGAELGGAGFELVVDLRMRLQVAQHRESGAHRQRIAGERARLVDRAGRRDLAHDVRAAAVGADRQPAADHLAERGQVGPDAVALLRAAEGDAEAGHHLVEDQQRAVPRRDLAQRLRDTRAAAARTPCSRRRARRSRPRSGRRASRNASRRRSTSLNGSAMVVSAKPCGTPCVSAMPSVAMPEPAFTSSESTWPW